MKSNDLHPVAGVVTPAPPVVLEFRTLVVTTDEWGDTSVPPPPLVLLELLQLLLPTEVGPG